MQYAHFCLMQYARTSYSNIFIFNSKTPTYCSRLFKIFIGLNLIDTLLYVLVQLSSILLNYLRHSIKYKMQ